MEMCARIPSNMTQLCKISSGHNVDVLLGFPQDSDYLFLFNIMFPLYFVEK